MLKQAQHDQVKALRKPRDNHTMVRIGGTDKPGACLAHSPTAPWGVSHSRERPSPRVSLQHSIPTVDTSGVDPMSPLATPKTMQSGL